MHRLGAVLSALGLLVCGLACIPGPMSWTPDSRHLLVWDVIPRVQGRSDTRLRLLDLDGKTVRTLAVPTETAFPGPGRVDPTGKRVAYLRLPEGNAEHVDVMVRDLQAAAAPSRWHREPLPALARGRDATPILLAGPRWLTDGRVALHLPVPGERGALILAAPGAVRRVAIPPAVWATCSPAGDRLLLARSHRGGFTLQLHTLARDGTLGEPRSLATTSRRRFPLFPHHWSADGTLHLGLDDGGEARVVRLNEGQRSVVWRRQGRTIGWIDVATAPGARRLVVEHRGPRRHVVELVDLAAGTSRPIHAAFAPDSGEAGAGSSKRTPMVKLGETAHPEIGPRIAPDGRHVALPAIGLTPGSDSETFAYLILDDRGRARGAHTLETDPTRRRALLAAILRHRLRAMLPDGLRARARAQKTLIAALRQVDLVRPDSPLASRAHDYLRWELAQGSPIHERLFERPVRAALRPVFREAFDTR